ncbi:MAG: hydroxysqualene dehydroxylase HpnE [Burkholderiales bacterium]|nr:hydroxysqualene dehydroxylase HpnE [Burkholderiales bacterium]
MRRVGVVGAGWAGLAAAVALADQGWQVVLWEMAPTPGGRGRSGIEQALPDGPVLELDAGQHILIGAYRESLGLMQRLGVDVQAAFWRGPLQLLDPKGQGLKLPSGPPVLAFVRALAGHSHWPWGARLRLLRLLARWHQRGFTCEPGLTVAQLCAALPPVVMNELIEPLCVAALNTPAQGADAQVFLRVLADGLFAGPGGSDLLIPRWPLRGVLPTPALAHLEEGGAQLHLADRVQALEPLGQGRWRVQAKATHELDRLLLATTAPEAARLLAPWDPHWAQAAQALRFEPIVTTWVHAPGVRLPSPMVRLNDGPAQFAFDLQAVGLPWPGGLSLVSSDAGPALQAGLPAVEQAVLQQALRLPGADPTTARAVRSIAERRATFVCAPGLQRPAPQAAAAHGGLWVAGDYIAGPYPSTLEGAVRSGVAAAQQISNS